MGDFKAKEGFFKPALAHLIDEAGPCVGMWARLSQDEADGT